MTTSISSKAKFRQRLARQDGPAIEGRKSLHGIQSYPSRRERRSRIGVRRKYKSEA